LVFDESNDIKLAYRLCASCTNPVRHTSWMHIAGHKLHGETWPNAPHGLCASRLPSMCRTHSNTQYWISKHSFALSQLTSTPIDLLTYQWVFQTMKVSYIVMGLIFVSQKPTFLCFSFGTFLILIQLYSSCFLFDFWLK